MSSPPDHEILTQAADWYARLQTDEADEDLRRAWKRWYDEHPDHAQAWECIECVTRKFNCLQMENYRAAAAATLQNPRLRAHSAPRAGQPSQPGRRRLLAGLMALGMGSLLWRTGVAGRANGLPDALAAWVADFRTQTGELREFVLEDESRLWLNTASRVGRTNLSIGGDDLPGLRLLAGECLLQCRGLHKYVLETPQGWIHATGARLSVRREGEWTRVAVFAGEAEIHLAAPAQAPDSPTATGLKLQAGEELRFNQGLSEAPQRAHTAREAWTRGLLVAEDISLAELAAELDRYRSGYLTVADSIAQQRVIGVFPLRNPDQALQILTQVLPVDIWQPLPGLTVLEPRRAPA